MNDMSDGRMYHSVIESKFYVITRIDDEVAINEVDQIELGHTVDELPEDATYVNADLM